MTQKIDWELENFKQFYYIIENPFIEFFGRLMIALKKNGIRDRQINHHSINYWLNWLKQSEKEKERWRRKHKRKSTRRERRHTYLKED